MSFYAGIGSRETPDDVLTLMTSIARFYRHRGLVLRSGGARGADLAFEHGAGEMSQIFTANGPIPEWALETVDRYHPAPERLTDYVRRLHARNAMILLGRHASEFVTGVVCWTPGAAIVGGTGQALRIAQAAFIPVHNLADPEVRAKYETLV